MTTNVIVLRTCSEYYFHLKWDRETIFLQRFQKGYQRHFYKGLTLVDKTGRYTRKEAMFTERAILLSAKQDWTRTHVSKSNIQLHVVRVIEEVSLF